MFADIARGVHTRQGSLHPVIDLYGLVHGHAKPAGQFQLRTNPGGKQHSFRFQDRTVFQMDLQHPAGLDDFAGFRAQVEPGPHLFEHALEHSCSLWIRLPGQQSGKNLHHLHPSPCLDQPVSSLEAQKSTADQRYSPPRAHCLPNPHSVVQGAQGEHPGKIRSRNGRHKGLATRGQQQGIITHCIAPGRGYGSPAGIDAPHRTTQPHIDPPLGIPLCTADGQTLFVLFAGDQLGQGRCVVEVMGLTGKENNAPCLIVLADGFGCAVGGRSVADDHVLLQICSSMVEIIFTAQFPAPLFGPNAAPSP